MDQYKSPFGRGGMNFPTLLIFSRYPQSGQTKTRLIPALGANGAAQLHQRMAERMLRAAQGLQQRMRPEFPESLDIQVWFTGGTIAQMQTWLGSDYRYGEQQGQTLGDRLQYALAEAFGVGHGVDPDLTTSPMVIPVVIIGTDCPQITIELLYQVFQLLHTQDLVLGPAADGGYYLIGLKRFLPRIFQDISWSTDRVLAETLTIAQALQLSVALLETLPDIDRPEDLVHLPPDLRALVMTV